MTKPNPIWLLVLALVFTVPASAQYTLTPTNPPPNFVFNDLWQFTVTRSMNDNYVQFYVSLRVTNASNGLQVKSNTATFALPVGVTYFNTTNISTLQPFSTSYYNGTLLQQVVASGGTFPPGVYNVAYTLYGKAKDGDFTTLADETIQTEVETMWPPMLLTPEDEEVIDTPYPLLTWTPAFSSTASQAIVYDLQMVLMLPGQNAVQAAKSNPGLFTQKDIPATMLSYPSTAEALKPGSKYAWFVSAKSGKESLGQSQIWSFEMGQKIDPLMPDEPYVELFTVPAPYVYKAAFGKLRIKYVEEYILPGPDDYLQFKIYNWMGKVVYAHTDLGTPISIKKGHNYIQINVASLALSGVGGTGPYLLEVYNHKNEKQYVRFLVDGVAVD